nr:RnfABCDGE type electron transport complex subunit D [Maliibacterium massiliense]
MQQNQPKYYVAPAPHIFHQDNTRRIMLDVSIALLPACIAGILFFGWAAAWVLVASVVSALAFEALYERLAGKPVTLYDGSALVTGLLLGMNLPATVPLWVPIFGAAFAIIIVKQFFGGLGGNFVNPALAARVVLAISFAGLMTKWTLTEPMLDAQAAAGVVDTVSLATPLAVLKNGSLSRMPDLWSVFVGNHPGCIGETSTLALLAGGLYLFARRVIDWRVTLPYLASVFVMTLLINNPAFSVMVPLYHLCSGGLMLGAIFMATDYVTSPVSKGGRIIFGLGCGVLTSVFRLFGNATEGVSYAILLMNLVSPLIDRGVRPRVFAASEVKRHA